MGWPSSSISHLLSVAGLPAISRASTRFRKSSTVAASLESAGPVTNCRGFIDSGLIGAVEFGMMRGIMFPAGKS